MTIARRLSGREMIRAACLALIAVVLVRLAVVIPGWVAGAPPAHPDQYLSRLYFALIAVPALSVSIMALGTSGGLRPRWRQVLPWVLLTVSLVAMMLDVRRG
jgi:hypothetical protein